MHVAQPVTSPETAKALDRVRKLLALSEKAGTPEEAGTAFAQAQKIIATHALSMEQIRQARLREAGGSAVDEPLVERILFVASGSSTPTWVGVLAMAIAEVNGCDVVWSTRFGPAAREVGAKAGVDAVKVLRGFGRASDLEVVEELIRLIVGRVNELVKTCGWTGRTALNNYRLGAVTSICERLREAAKAARLALQASAETHDAGNAAATSCTSLALRTLDGRLERAKTELRAKVPGLRTRSSSSTVDLGARADGRAAGRTVSLSRSRAIGGGR